MIATMLELAQEVAPPRGFDGWIWEQGPTVVLALIVGWLIVKGVFVTRGHLEEVKQARDEYREDRDYWRDVALDLKPIASGAISLAERRQDRRGG